MAYAKALDYTDEETMECPLCLSIYSSLSMLPCAHSFCENCLAGLKNEQDLPEDELDCPTCEMKVKVGTKKSRRSNDVSQEAFKTVKRLPETRKKNEKRLSNVCSGCFKSGKNVPSVCFCFDCDSYLCMKCKKIHLDFEEMIGKKHHVQEYDESKKVTMEQKRQLIYCSIHPSKKFEYLCQDHDALCCHQCVIVFHRRCKCIRTIEDYAVILKGEQKLNSAQTDILSLREKTLKLSKEDSDKIQSITNRAEQVAQQLNEFEENVVLLVSTMKAKLITETKSKCEEIKNRFKDHGKKCLHVEADMQNVYDLATTSEEDSDLQTVGAYRFAQRKLAGLVDQLGELNESAPDADMHIFFDNAASEIKKCLEKVTLKTFESGDHKSISSRTKERIVTDEVSGKMPELNAELSLDCGNTKRRQKKKK